MTGRDPTQALARGYVASSVAGVEHPPESLVPIFTAWLRSPDEELRIGAAYALRSIDTRAVIAPLLNYGINDSSPRVRYHAVSAPAEVTGEMQVMATEPFAEREAEYIGYWRRRKPALLADVAKK
jgi:hypothetical protein